MNFKLLLVLSFLNFSLHAQEAVEILLKGIKESVERTNHDPNKYRTYNVYKLAKEKGIDLISDEFPEAHISNFDGESLFYLFHNGVQTKNAKSEFLIQRVKKRVRIQSKDGSWSDKTTYLVEIFKLRPEGHIPRFDQHYGDFHVSEDLPVKIIQKELEIGFGTIPGLIESNNWSFDPRTLFVELGKYRDADTGYNNVNFRVAKKWKIDLKVDYSGVAFLRVPEFDIDLKIEK